MLWFLINGGVLNEHAYPDSFQVVVACDEDALRAHMIEERLKEMDPYFPHHDGEYLRAYLNMKQGLKASL